ncbi:hypothetical protein PHLCEN_2v11636 [Hermanssonia centrifuga]|uniref:Uncharacterized protein n=1 Tax=Hermanssonia centrifuga TaxID=98765 RepID=A0A2R6NJG9_9APHY|nr:hypothetical protein PHLCEN_2v11636 [Hermanssonia centrifuga]
MPPSNATLSSEIKDVADLDPLLQPVWRCYTDEELRRFDDLPPFDTLPLPFIRDRRLRPKPPLMYFGWKIDVDKWFDYAKLNDLIVVARVIYLEGEDDSDFSDNEDDDIPETVVKEVDTLFSVAEVCWSFLWELKITPYTTCPLKCSMGMGESRVMLALRDNYKGNSSLTARKLRKLQDKLGETGPPKWYPSNHFHWTYY